MRRLDSHIAARRFGAVCTAVFLALALGGCRFSNELIEVHYNQDAEFIDYESEQKNYVPNPDAELISDATVPVYTETDLDGIETVEEIVPIFDIPGDTDIAIEQIFYDPESPLARTAPIFSQEQDRPDEEDEDEDQDTDEESDFLGTAEAGGQGVSDLGPEEGEGEGDADGDVGTLESPESTHRPSDRGQQAFNSSGGLIEPLEDIHKVATVGEYANLVQIIGGPGVLCAADSDFVGNADNRRIFGGANWNFASVAQAWSHSASDGTYSVDFDALIASDPDLVLIPEGVTLLSDAQIAALNANGTSVEPAPALTTTSAISQLAGWLGNSIDVSDTGYDCKVRADIYRNDFLGADINDLLMSNGGLTTYNGIDYSASGTPVNPTADNWTVLVTDWDPSATYHAKAGGSTFWSSKGLALATCGYAWSPVNYYMSVGGVNNNAAQFPDPSSAKNQTRTYPVWQFNLGQLSAAASNFTGVTKPFSELKSSGDAACLVRAPASFTDVADESDVISVLGAPTFRYVLCADQGITDSFMAAQAADTAAQYGLYAAYQWRTAGLISGIGYVSPTAWLVESWIGNLPSWSVPNHESICSLYSPAYGIRTIGNGLYCDWVNGSAESFLMAFWINDFYDSADSDYSSFATEAAKFYGTFYEYALTDSDIMRMINGKAA